MSVAAPTVTTSTCGKPVCTWNAFGPKTYVRPPEDERRERHEDDDRRAVFTDSFSVLNTATQYTLHIVTTEGTRAIIRLNGKRVVDEDDFREQREDKDRDDCRGREEQCEQERKKRKPETVIVDRPVALNLSDTLVVELLGEPGSSLEVSIIGVDNDPPTIAAVATPAANSFGWNNTNVLVTFTCSDHTSGVAFCPAPVAVTTEGANQPISGTAVDRAGNTATLSLTVSLDKTPPVITAAITPPPNALGFVIAPATITFTCTDALSGVLSCPSPIQVINGGLNQTFSGTATDKAGNSSTASVTLNVQSATPLTIVASASPPANINGWNNSNVTISYTCSGGVPPVSCPGTQIVSTEGANQSVSASATDAAGQSVSTSTILNIDKTNPTITATVTPTPNANGVVTAPATITFTCTDALSGVVTCPASLQATALGANQTFSGTATDKAGNSASTSVTISVQGSPLLISAAASPPPNAAGWNMTDVSLSYQCSGGVPPITCPDSQTIGTEGPSQTIVATAVDAAEQAASASTTLSIDKTPPSISATSSPAANSAGWNNTPVTVSFICADSGSGVAVCPAPITVNTEGRNQIVSGTATDVAGNTNLASVTLKIDRTAPLINIAVPQANNVNTGQVTIQGLISDALSGVTAVTCNGSNASLTGENFMCSVQLALGSNSVAVSASDAAGNTTSSNLALTFATPLNVQIATPTALQLFSANPITVTGTVDKADATVTVGNVTTTASNGTFVATGVVLREGKNLLTVGATSPDGSVGSATVTVYLDTTPPVVHIDNPSDNATVTTPQIDITGNVNDLVTGTVNGDQVSVVVNGVSANVANRTFAAHGVLLVPGMNTVTAVATDRAGNTGQHQVRVVLRQISSQQTLTIQAGNNQTAAIGTLLPRPLTVQATDAIGRPIANVPLTFSVIASDGLITSGEQQARTLSVRTDNNGNASVSFRLGSRSGVGNNRVSVSSPGFVEQVVFSADSTVGVPKQIHTVSGEIQTGAVRVSLPESLVAIVFDAGGNPVPNVPVTFAVQSGGGSIGGQPTLTQNTDSDGKVFATLVLGQQEGINNNVVTASFSGLSGQPAVFTSSAVVPGPISSTSVSGIVLDDANEPIPNVTASIKGTRLSALTNASGRFTIPNVPVGDIVLFVDGTTSTEAESYPTLSFQMATIPGINNTLPGPIFLPALDVGNSNVVGGDQDVILTMKDVPGVAYKIFAHSVTFPNGSHVGSLTLSQVHADKVPMTPPNGTSPRLVGTLQPAGVRFDPPIQLTFPNTDGLAPGQALDIFSFHHDVEQFVTEGTARVSEDGSIIVSDPGFGLSVSGWHGGFGNPPPTTCGNGCAPCEKCQNGQCTGNPVQISDLGATVGSVTDSDGPVLVALNSNPTNFVMNPVVSSPPPAPLQFTWDFGDGGTSSDQSPTYAYQAPNLYTVSAQAECPTCPDSQKQQSIQVAAVMADSVTASLSSTKNVSSQTGPADGTFSTKNSDTAFLTSGSDLMVVLQNAGTITVKADNVQPADQAPNLKWTIDRNPDDTVAADLPQLSGSPGSQVTLTPSTPGSFRLILYADTNKNNKFDSGEELKVLRFAIVRATVQPKSQITSALNFTTTTGKDFLGAATIALNPGDSTMGIQAQVLLEGGGGTKQIGVDQIVIGDVGNLLDEKFTINYGGTPPGTGTSTPSTIFKVTLPMVDTARVGKRKSPTGGDTAFRVSSNTSAGQGTSGGQLVQLAAGDNPKVNWQQQHPHTDEDWQSTGGATQFAEYVVGYSQTFNRNYLALAKGTWTITWTGTNVNDDWKDGGANVSLNGQKGAKQGSQDLILTGFPQPADAAGVQVLGVSFTNENSIIYKP